MDLPDATEDGFKEIRERVMCKLEVRDTLEMLLEAKWSHSFQCFVKIVRRTHPNGLATHFELFYNEQGVECGRPKGFRSA